MARGFAVMQEPGSGAMSADNSQSEVVAIPNRRSRRGRKPSVYYGGETKIIQRRLELRGQGMGFDKLAESLNAEAIPSRSGKPWYGRVVNRILKAERQT